MLTVVKSMDDSKNGAAESFGFEDAWLLHPRKEAKKDAMKAWNQVVTPADVVPIFTALVEWRKVWAARESSRFIPLFASWLRGERWHDEIPLEFATPTHASHVPVKPQDDTPRGEMPESVRAALAKLRKG